MALPSPRPTAAHYPYLYINGLLPGTSVKQERQDDAEITAMAARIAEENRAKVAKMTILSHNIPLRPGTNTMANFVIRAAPKNGQTPPVSSTQPDKPPFDLSSQKGKFGWFVMGEESIPYIYRSDEKYCSVRMVEMKLLAKYLNTLNPDIYTCASIRSYFITDNEARLLSEINMKHSDGHFGREAFTSRDLVVKLNDANEFYYFLDLCYNKLINPLSSMKQMCGFIRINNESVVPYTYKDSKQYVPLFYFEGETDTLKDKAVTLEGWDLAYLKFCCKVQGIRSELFESDTCVCVSLDNIRSYFSSGSRFEEYWPEKVVESTLLVSQKRSASWTRAPASPAPTTPVETASSVIVSKVTKGPRTYTPRTVMPQQNTAGMMQPVRYGSRVTPLMPVSSGYFGYQGVPAYQTGPGQYPPMRYPTTAQRTAPPPPPPLVRVSAAQPTTIHYYSAPPQDVVDLSSPSTSGINGNAMRQVSRVTRHLTQLPEVPARLHSQSYPYKMYKDVIGNKMVSCINMKPYTQTDLLMTVADLIDYFFPQVSLVKCREVLQEVLNIELYSGNLQQKTVLRENGRCQSLNDELPLIKTKDVSQYMPQMTYIMGNLPANDPAYGQPSKRARIQ